MVYKAEKDLQKLTKLNSDKFFSKKDTIEWIKKIKGDSAVFNLRIGESYFINVLKIHDKKEIVPEFLLKGRKKSWSIFFRNEDNWIEIQIKQSIMYVHVIYYDFFEE